MIIGEVTMTTADTSSCSTGTEWASVDGKILRVTYVGS